GGQPGKEARHCPGVAQASEDPVDARMRDAGVEGGEIGRDDGLLARVQLSADAITKRAGCRSGPAAIASSKRRCRA
ncbi:MAG: hypothetical protein AAFV96_12105, partial [Pseudomonadota bacterium]